MASRKRKTPHEPEIHNRRARHDYLIEDTLECGIRLLGTEVKSIREGKVSLAEGYIRAVESPLALTLHGVHIAEYPPAGEANQHQPTRTRALLAQRRQIRKLAAKTRDKGQTIVPLKMYFVRGRVKLLIGLGRGKRKADKRQALDRREAKRDMDRALSRRR
ncbi:MAG: SsrA-binding protein SmpB [Phycisphaerales bacterium]|nr:MAG: SsrA-binding protein SmpB [Phycisphaerales bacterium]